MPAGRVVVLGEDLAEGFRTTATRSQRFPCEKELSRITRVSWSVICASSAFELMLVVDVRCTSAPLDPAQFLTVGRGCMSRVVCCLFVVASGSCSAQCRSNARLEFATGSGSGLRGSRGVGNAVGPRGPCGESSRLTEPGHSTFYQIGVLGRWHRWLVILEIGNALLGMASSFPRPLPFSKNEVVFFL